MIRSGDDEEEGIAAETKEELLFPYGRDSLPLFLLTFYYEYRTFFLTFLQSQTREAD
jgi:hypothetical protein